MKIQVSDDDAPAFIEQNEACARGVARLLRPPELIAVKINNWFGPKWLPFSAPTRDPDAGIPANYLSLPLFVPNRVIGQLSFAAPNYVEHVSRRSVHARVRTSHARQRLMSDVLPGTAIIWYSGNSRPAGRGSLLVYLPMGDRYHAWYAGWYENGEWRLALTKGTAIQDLVRFIGIGLVTE
jgi:hypothetical protein